MNRSSNIKAHLHLRTKVNRSSNIKVHHPRLRSRAARIQTSKGRHHSIKAHLHLSRVKSI